MESDGFAVIKYFIVNDKLAVKPGSRFLEERKSPRDGAVLGMESKLDRNKEVCCAMAKIAQHINHVFVHFHFVILFLLTGDVEIP